MSRCLVRLATSRLPSTFRGESVPLPDLVRVVRLVAQPTAGEEHFDQEGEERAHREKQRQTEGHEQGHAGLISESADEQKQARA